MRRLEWVPVTLDYRRTDLDYGHQLLKSALRRLGLRLMRRSFHVGGA